MSEVVATAPPARPAPRSRAATRELWRERLDRFASSGLTVPQFCAVEACSVPSFYAWKRRLVAQATAHEPAAQATLRLLPVRLPPSCPMVEIVLSNGALLRLLPGCDLAWVRSLVAALGESSC
jgi:hypothetical protein